MVLNSDAIDGAGSRCAVSDGTAYDGLWYDVSGSGSTNWSPQSIASVSYSVFLYRSVGRAVSAKRRGAKGRERTCDGHPLAGLGQQGAAARAVSAGDVRGERRAAYCTKQISEWRIRTCSKLLLSMATFRNSINDRAARFHPSCKRREHEPVW